MPGTVNNRPADPSKRSRKTLDLTGTSNKTYDLDKIEAENRTNSTQELVIHVHEYKAGENPNPDNLVLGQIWISKKVD